MTIAPRPRRISSCLPFSRLQGISGENNLGWLFQITDRLTKNSVGHISPVWNSETSNRIVTRPSSLRPCSCLDLFELLGSMFSVKPNSQRLDSMNCIARRYRLSESLRSWSTPTYVGIEEPHARRFTNTHHWWDSKCAKVDSANPRGKVSRSEEFL